MSVTRNDVAKLASVSPAVVSYVLNDGPRPVAQATRQRVLDAIEQLGYRRDGLARSLRLGTTRTLGFILPDASNPFFAELSRAVEDAAFDRGYGVLVCNTANDPSRERVYIEGLAERRVDGLVFVPSASRPDLGHLTGLGIPIVALDRLPDTSPMSTIGMRNEHGAEIGTRHLLEHGHRLVAFVGGHDATVTEARRKGWAAAHREAERAEGPMILAPFTYDGGRMAAEQLFSSEQDRPTAVLVATDVQAFGLLSGINALGLRVPEDVAVISIDGTTAGRYAVPPLSTIAQPIEQMGRSAVATLLDNKDETVHIVLDDTLVIRRSCGCEPDGS